MATLHVNVTLPTPPIYTYIHTVLYFCYLSFTIAYSLAICISNNKHRFNLLRCSTLLLEATEGILATGYGPRYKIFINKIKD